LGLAEPSQVNKPSKKRVSDQITEGAGSEEEDEDEDAPATKKFKVDKCVLEMPVLVEATKNTAF
jgi:hypothetical protein